MTVFSYHVEWGLQRKFGLNYREGKMTTFFEYLSLCLSLCLVYKYICYISCPLSGVISVPQGTFGNARR